MKQDCVNAGTFAKLCDEIQKLESERDALAAHVEQLRKRGAELLNNCMTELGYRSESLWHATGISTGSVSFKDSADSLADCINETPQQHLNAVKREVAREAFIDGSTDAVAFISQQLDLGKTDIDLDAGAAADKYVKTKYPSREE